jgi:hypothetical protein
VQGCDFLVTAVGDCGSCSAATVADGILRTFGAGRFGAGRFRAER